MLSQDAIISHVEYGTTGKESKQHHDDDVSTTAFSCALGWTSLLSCLLERLVLVLTYLTKHFGATSTWMQKQRQSEKGLR